jgi:hypothetical protein
MPAKVKPDPIGTPCRRGPKAAKNSGPRKASAIQFHVVHAAEGSTAAGVANYLNQPYVKGSVQRCVDDVEGVRILSDLLIPWGAPPLNTGGIHDELASFSRWRPQDWYKRLRMLQREAWFIARDCHVYGIPVRWLDAPALKRIGSRPGKGKGGITDHVQVTRAFGQTDHTDPGPGFEKEIPKTASGAPGKLSPRHTLMTWVRFYYKKQAKKAKKGKAK